MRAGESGARVDECANGGVVPADAVCHAVLRLPLGLRPENVRGPLFTPRLVP